MRLPPRSQYCSSSASQSSIQRPLADRVAALSALMTWFLPCLSGGWSAGWRLGYVRQRAVDEGAGGAAAAGRVAQLRDVLRVESVPGPGHPGEHGAQGLPAGGGGGRGLGQQLFRGGLAQARGEAGGDP